MGVCHDQEIDDPALDALPRAYRLGLLLQALGADDELIADCLDIDPAGVVTLLDIGARKLEHAQQATHATDTADTADTAISRGLA